MTKTIIAITALALAGLSMQQERLLGVPLKEEILSVEYTATANEAVLRMEAESEVELRSIQVLNPEGQTILDLRAHRAGRHSLSGFVIEMQETTAEQVFAAYPAGMYQIRGRTVDGRRAHGRAKLSHALPLVPQVIFPYEGAVNVPVKQLTLSWLPDNEVDGYVVSLEQDENDGLTVNLPPGSSSFTVPAGVLLPGKESQFELGAIGPDGNCTLVEIIFHTQ